MAQQETFAASGTVDLGQLRINDIYFSIPPESIAIIKNEYDSSTFMLRAPIASTVKSGKMRINVSLPIVIDLSDGRTGYAQVARLLTQIRKSPIVTVENEKIRKEILGIGSVTSTNIALLVENISGYIDREFPTLLRLDLQMTWFNHLPYTPNLLYQGATSGVLQKQEQPKSKAPSSLFTEFVEYNTKIEGQFLNDPSGSQVFILGDGEGMNNDLDIMYKEYQSFPNSLDKDNPTGEPSNPSKKGPKQRVKSKLEKAKKTRNVDEDKKLLRGGWNSASKHWGYDEPDSIYYRWRKLSIPTVALGESGALILEDVNFSLSTNISYIPLQGYSIPTAQFMGGSVGSMRGIVFAAPEYTEENKPKETSLKLSHLQKIFDGITHNRFQYAKYAKEDYVLVRHPMAKLLKYLGFQERRPTNDNRFFDEASNSTIPFDYNDCLPMVLSNRVSQTIEGIPFASRLQFDLKETRLREDNDMVRMLGEDEGDLSRVTIKESWRNVLLAIEKRYKIKLEPGLFGGGVFTINPDLILKKQNNPDQEIAQLLAQAMTYTLGVNGGEAKDLESMLDSPRFKQTTGEMARDYGKLLREGVRTVAITAVNPIAGGVYAGAASLSAIFGDEKTFINSENVTFMVTELLKKCVTVKFEDWAKQYKEISAPIRNFNSVPVSQTYPDLQLPLNRQSPTYYYHDYNAEAEVKMAGARGAVDSAAEQDQHIFNHFQDPEAGEKMAEATGEGDRKMMSSRGTEEGASNLAAMIGEEKKHGLVHNPIDQKYRTLTSVQAIQHASSMVNSMKYAFPTFKIFLKQDNKLFERELSISDLPADQRRNLSHGFRDFSEHFDVSDIIDIRIVKDETNPADLLIMRVVATQKDKVNRAKQEMEEQRAEEALTHEKVMDIVTSKTSEDISKLTRLEERLKAAGLTEGTRIQARLGYETNPNRLPVEFNGKIVSVRGTDIIEVISLGNGEELVKEIKGVNQQEQYTFNSNTPDFIAKLLSKSPELVSFGNINYKSNLGLEISIFPTFLGGTTVLDNIFAPSLFTEYTNIVSEFIDGAELGISLGLAAVAVTTYIATAGVGTVGAAIAGTGITTALGTGVFAAGVAGGSLVAGGGAAGLVGSAIVGVAAFAIASPVLFAVGAIAVSVGILYAGLNVALAIKRFFYGSPFTIYNNTLWEILNEMTLRHPGTIVATLPYDNRSTIYFGEPHEPYFYRGPTPYEAGIAVGPDESFNFTAREILDAAQGIDKNTKTEDKREKRKVLRGNLEKNNKQTPEKVITNMQKPFRNYHMVTSEHDIIRNDIECTSRGVANSIQVAYPNPSFGDAEDSGNFDGTEGFSSYDLSMEIQADDDINPEYINKKVLTFHNAHKETVKDMPERYAKAALCKELERVYRGKLSILGRAGIKPHDVMILRDSYNSIFGPVGVSKVVHSFSPQGGFVTEITPKMMVFPDNSTGMYQLATVVKACNFWLADEADRFYTNARRFMPDDYEGAGGHGDAVKAWNYVTGSDYVDLETKDVENTKTGNIPNLDFRSSDSDVSHVLASGINLAAGKVGFETAAKVGSKFGLTESAAKLALLEGGAAFDIATTSTVKATVAKSGTTAAAKYGSALFRGGGFVLGKFGGLITTLMMGSLINGFVNWSKYRQPVMFYPLTRYGEPWYAALNGFKDNTIIGHFKSRWEKTVNKLDYYYELTANQIDGYYKYLG